MDLPFPTHSDRFGEEARDAIGISRVVDGDYPGVVHPPSSSSSVLKLKISLPEKLERICRPCSALADTSKSPCAHELARPFLFMLTGRTRSSRRTEYSTTYSPLLPWCS